MKNEKLWEVTWARSKLGVDVETSALISAETATDSIRLFILLFPEQRGWDKQVIRTEKNHTYFLFTFDKSILRRI